MEIIHEPIKGNHKEVSKPQTCQIDATSADPKPLHHSSCCFHSILDLQALITEASKIEIKNRFHVTSRMAHLSSAFQSIERSK